MRAKGTMRRVALLACCLAACAALPEHRQLKTKRVECSEANEGDEIVFDCGGEFISTITFASYGAQREAATRRTARRRLAPE